MNEAYRNGSLSVSDRRQSKKLVDSTHSQQSALIHKLKAPKAFVRSLFSKARGACDHHSHTNISIQKESFDDEDAAAVHRGIPGVKPHATHRKCFSGSFSFIKESLLIHKPNLKSSSSPSHESPFLKRSIESENCVEEAIAHCKQSHSADPKNVIGTS